jgi:hypothetical protein
VTVVFLYRRPSTGKTRALYAREFRGGSGCATDIKNTLMGDSGNRRFMQTCVPIP